MRYLGNINSKEFHALTRKKPQCQIERLQALKIGKTFAPDTLVQAIREGFEPCPHCLGILADLPLEVGGTLPAAADLRGEDLGNGNVSLQWTHPDDIVTRGIRFDVYSSLSPLDPLRALRLSQHATTSATLSGFTEGGDVYFTVIARLRSLQSLPTPILHVFVQPAQAAVELNPAAPGTRTASGLGFPFHIDGLGRVHAQGGDPLLRGKILQLLLTAPGERVNLPEYGTRLRDLVFEPNNEVLAATTEFTVMRALGRFLGEELLVDRVQVSTRDNELSVDIVYLRRSDLSTERLRVGIPLPR